MEKERIHPTDAEIKAAIKYYHERHRQLEESLTGVRKDLAGLEEEWYHAVTIPEGTPDGIRRGRPGQDPVLPKVMRKDEELEQYREEYRMWIRELESELRQMERIWLAYRLLPWEEHQVLQKLYEEKVAWKNLMPMTGMSKSRLIRLRQKAMSHIREAVLRADTSGYRRQAGNAGMPEEDMSGFRRQAGDTGMLAAETGQYGPENIEREEKDDDRFYPGEG